MVGMSAVLGIAAVAFGVVLIPRTQHVLPGVALDHPGSRCGTYLVGGGRGGLRGVPGGGRGRTRGGLRGGPGGVHRWLKVAGGVYLLYLAWQAFRPGGTSRSPPNESSCDDRRIYRFAANAGVCEESRCCCHYRGGSSGAAVIGVVAPVQAAPSGPGNAQDTISALQAQGFNVVVNKLGTAPLNQSSVIAVRRADLHQDGQRHPGRG